MKNDCIIIRIDPEAKTIATMRPTFGRNAVGTLRRLIRARYIGARELLEVEGIAVTVAAARDVDLSRKMWRLRGSDETAGIGVIYGRVGGDSGGMCDTPVDAAWVRERIQWLDGASTEQLEERARETLAQMEDDVRLAVSRAIVLPPDGQMWLSAADKAQVGNAMVALGLGTERSGGQQLTDLGERVHDLLDDVTLEGVS